MADIRKPLISLRQGLVVNGDSGEEETQYQENWGMRHLVNK